MRASWKDVSNRIWVPGDSLSKLAVTSARSGSLKPGALFIFPPRCGATGAIVLAVSLCATSRLTADTTRAAAVTPVTRGATTWSLAQVRELAFERNWDLLAAKSGVDNATAQLLVTREFPNPTASWSTAYIGTHNNGITLADGSTHNGIWSRNYDTIAAVSQLIEIGGKRGDRQTAARAGVAGARARFYDAKRTLDQGVTKAYVAAMLAGDNARILNESAGYLRREADIAEARYKAGDISESDRNQIDINAGQFELQARSAEAAAVQARVAVEILIGIDHPTGQWTPADSLDQLVQTPPQSVAATNDAARSDVLAAQADLRNARANLQLQKAERIPDPTFSVEEQHQPPGLGPPTDTLGFGVSFPLPLWNLNGGNIKAARASVDQSELALEKVRAQVAADIANARTEYDEAYARWMRYRDQICPKSAKVREAISFAYGKGGAALLDLLDAERTDNDVRLAAAQAMSDTASAAADLAAAQFVLTENDLNSMNP
jgi:cobalt-zinc-cadmium efflux system outer membrane protein